MIQSIQSWLARFTCKHEFRYSRSKPGTLVCKKCRARRKPPR